LETAEFHSREGNYASEDFQIQLIFIQENFTAHFNTIRNLDQIFRFNTNPDHTEHEVLELQKFPRFASDDLDLQMVEFLENTVRRLHSVS